MEDLLEIPVTYKNQELVFKAHLKQFGYVNQIAVDVNGTTLTIERDEEGNYRAIGDAEQTAANKVDLELVKALVEVLENL